MPYPTALHGFWGESRVKDQSSAGKHATWGREYGKGARCVKYYLMSVDLTRKEKCYEKSKGNLPDKFLCSAAFHGLGLRRCRRQGFWPPQWIQGHLRDHC